MKALRKLSHNVKALCVPRECVHLSCPPDPLDFYREYVSASIPVVIENAFNHWPALTMWTDAYLSAKLGDRLLSVEVTPSK